MRSLLQPTDNAYIEAFNGKFRQECLNAHWFMGLEDTAEKLEAWRTNVRSGISLLSTLDAYSPRELS